MNEDVVMAGEGLRTLDILGLTFEIGEGAVMAAVKTTRRRTVSTTQRWETGAKSRRR